MHKGRYNALVLDIRLSPRGPLLVKHGGTSADPSLPDMQFVRTYHARLGETVYIPGSSLKGAVRGFVEKVLRTMDDSSNPGPAAEKGWRWACATFEDRRAGRGDRAQWACPQFLRDGDVLRYIRGEEERELHSWEVYRWSCGACRMFGHTRLRGRVSFTDLVPLGAVRTETRYGVAISRLSHAVAQGPFDIEVVVAGTFGGQVVLENFELWQLALLATALQAMEAGLLKVGFGKNRGFGEVCVAVSSVRLDEAARGAAPDAWRGLGAIVNGDLRRAYGLSAPDRLDGMPQPASLDRDLLYLRRTYDSAAWERIVQRSVAALGVDGGQG